MVGDKIKTEEILVPCAHCDGTLDLAKEEHCPKCGLSTFLSPEEAFDTLVTPYDFELANKITERGKKYLRQLLDLQLANEPKAQVFWTDKPKPSTSLQVEIARAKNKTNWCKVFEEYVNEVPDWKTNDRLPLTEWLTINYNAPTKKV